MFIHTTRVVVKSTVITVSCLFISTVGIKQPLLKEIKHSRN